MLPCLTPAIRAESSHRLLAIQAVSLPAWRFVATQSMNGDYSILVRLLTPGLNREFAVVDKLEEGNNRSRKVLSARRGLSETLGQPWHS